MSAKNYRDARTGQYTTAADAAARPAETVSETVPTRHEAPDVAELRRLAEAATPGPWKATIFDSGHSKFEFEASVCTQDVGDSICRMDGLLRTADNERYRTDGSLDALYIAAVSPDVVLGLLNRLAHMTEARDNARAEVERLSAQVEAVRKWATACATQANDYDEDTEQQIEDGRKVLRILGATPGGES